ncbi:uncharacterized protein PFL1_05812 [Pseudozyma flocculosa PF-1]|uniref:Conserved oligomeric Golgi complex subunit 1 n=2 Tax=Pseudozyma flocculosa TaxID=84751 RepID=A0A5C3F221_9BASI|nr:uncharacterized protein PFL1_05812 [Pseudozyma flocculosa PF-1]EPQ26490.1 hypothetical protein PFL1_05812 [Pseudozyma flocculosa PF-1]SPO38524.1 uncharacterized protein PSFLO_04002 [Pseudozyma flocculosa]
MASQSHASGSSSQPHAADAATSSSPTKSRRARHARTPASLTSSAGAAPSISSIYGSGSQTHSSISASEAVFTSMGLNPFRTDPDELFNTLSVKQVETYANAVRQAAERKQSDLRTLVGERYQDLLGTANTIIGMANSSSQLCKRLDQLHDGLVATGKRASQQSERRVSRRLSSFAIPSVAEQQSRARHANDTDHELDEAEHMYRLGASLKTIMDAPEYVWRTIEKGKTLHAAWAFMVARTVWWDLMERSPSNDKRSNPAEGNAERAERGPQIDVKAAFPFIEKQWQGLVPMRKQIVQRAIQLIADCDLGFSATADQLAAIVLLDGTRLEQTFALVLSQRKSTLKRHVRRRYPSAALGQRRGFSDERRPSNVAFDRASTVQGASGIIDGSSRILDRQEKAEEKQLEAVLHNVVRGVSNTLTHLVRAYFLPQQASEGSLLLFDEDLTNKMGPPVQPYLYELLHRLTQPPVMAGDDASTSPGLARRASILQSPQVGRSGHQGHSPSSTSPTARRSAARRRSSYGFSLPLPSTSSSATRAAPGNSDDQHAETHRRQSQAAAPPQARVSTYEILHSLPSSHLLLRYLPLSVLSFVPYVELHPLDEGALDRLASELRTWSLQLREELFAPAQDAEGRPGDSIPSLLLGLSRIASVAKLRAGTMATLSRSTRTAERKMNEVQRTTTEHGRAQGAVQLFKDEMTSLRDELDRAFLGRLEAIHASSLAACKADALQEVDGIVADLDGRETGRGSLALLFAEEGDGSDGNYSRLEGRRTTSQGRKSQAIKTPGPTHEQLAVLDGQLRGRSADLDGVVGSLSLQLTVISSDTDAFLSQRDFDPATRDGIRSKLRQSLSETLLGLLSQLQGRISTPSAAHTPAIGGGIEIEPRRALMAKLASLMLRDGALAQLVATGKDCHTQGPEQSLTAAAKGLVEVSLRDWADVVRSLCLSRLSSTDVDSEADAGGPSRHLIDALSLLAEATLRAGVGIDPASIDEMVRSVLDALRLHVASASRGEESVDVAMLDLLLRGTTVDDESVRNKVDEAVARRWLVLAPISVGGTLAVKDRKRNVQGPGPAATVEDVTPLVGKTQLPRFEALSLG